MRSCGVGPLHVVHHRQGARSSADDQATALPGDLLFQGDRGVSELLAEFLRGLLPTFAHIRTVDHHVVLISNAVDSDRTKGKLLDAHTYLRDIVLPLAIERLQSFSRLK